MVILVQYRKRRMDLSPEQNKAYFLDRHAQFERMVVQKSPTTKIVASFATGEMAIGWPRTKVIGGKETPFDHLVKLYYDSTEDMRVAFAGGKISAIMRKDEENFTNLSSPKVRTVAEEYITAEKTPEKFPLIPLPMKAVRIVKRRNDLTREQFKAYWLDKHAQFERMVVEKSPTRKIVATFATGEMLGGEEPPFDAIVELYFYSTNDMRATFAGEIPAIMAKDEENFIDLSGEVGHVFMEEIINADRKLTDEVSALFQHLPLYLR